MAFDGTPIAQPSDPITGYDVIRIEILPQSQQINYKLAVNYTSGTTTLVEKRIPASDFAAAGGSFLQATPKRKFLTWLAANGYESNITPV